MAGESKAQDGFGRGGPTATEQLVAVIGDEDTVTGFLLAGVGHRDGDGSNFLVVDSGEGYVLCGRAIDCVEHVLARQPVQLPFHGNSELHAACN